MDNKSFGQTRPVFVLTGAGFIVILFKEIHTSNHLLGQFILELNRASLMFTRSLSDLGKLIRRRCMEKVNG